MNVPAPHLLDGGMGTFLLPLVENHTSTLQCTDTLNHFNPRAVIAAHSAFLAAGARFLTTNTFCCDALSLQSSGLDPLALSQAGAALADQAKRQHHDAENITIMGSLGPGWLSPEKKEITPQALTEEYARRATGLLQGGVDAFVIETIRDLLQAEAALRGIEKALEQSLHTLQRKYPVFMMASVSSTHPQASAPTPKTDSPWVGQHPVAQALQTLMQWQPSGLGFNCGEGPHHLSEPLSYLRSFEGAILLKPNAGRPGDYLSPQAFALAMKPYLTHQNVCISHWGGCCGTSPEHLNALDLLSQQRLKV